MCDDDRLKGRSVITLAALLAAQACGPLLVWEGWIRDHPAAPRLPPIIPVVLHHSTTGWNRATSFDELLDVEPDVLPLLGDHVLRLRFVLDDVSHKSDEELLGRALTALGRLVYLCLRHARDDELLPHLARWTDAMRAVMNAPNGAAALATVFRYVMLVGQDVSPARLKALVVAELGREAERVVTTAGEQLIQQGLQQGLQQGIEQGIEQGLQHLRDLLLKQLRARFGPLPDDAVASIRAAGSDALEAYGIRFVNSKTLADVLRAAPASAKKPHSVKRGPRTRR